MHHHVAWVAAAIVAACVVVAVVSPVRVRLRVRVRNDALLRPRIDVQLLWGLVHLRPRVHLPRHPLRDMAVRLGIPLGTQPRQRPQDPARRGPRRRVSTGTASSRARRTTRGLQHAASATPAGRYLFSIARAVCVRRLRLSVALQAGDAARTAVAAGAVWGLLGAAAAALAVYVRFERAPHLDVRPLFTGRVRLLADLDCILAARLGHVMVAALRSLLGGGTERGDAA